METKVLVLVAVVVAGCSGNATPASSGGGVSDANGFTAQRVCDCSYELNKYTAVAPGTPVSAPRPPDSAQFCGDKGADTQAKACAQIVATSHADAAGTMCSCDCRDVLVLEESAPGFGAQCVTACQVAMMPGSKIDPAKYCKPALSGVSK